MRFSGAARRPYISRSTLDQQRRHKPDYLLVLICVILLAIGLVVVYAITPGISAQKGVSENYYVGRQAVAIGIGAAAFLLTANLPIKYWRRSVKFLIAAAVISAGIVQFLGEEVNGASRWIQIGGLSFQAVELIKFALLIWLAGFLADRVSEGKIEDMNETFKPLLVALGLAGVVVALLQSDLGSTGVIVAIVGGMSYIAGFPLKRVLLFLGLIGIGTVLAISSSSYRRERLFTYLNPEVDCQDAGYQSCQALIAIGSGGMFGRDISGSVQAFGYLPESANDSIFAVYAEMFGFVGVVVLISLFMALFYRLKRIIVRTGDIQSRLIVTGVLAWISTQMIINIGAMVGLLPLKGITLPFISYGGTSIIFITAIIGLAFNVSRYITYGTNTIVRTERERYENPANRRGDGRTYNANISRRR